MRRIRSQNFINRSCCLRNSENCPVSLNIARSELLWWTRKMSLRYFSWIHSRFSIGFSWNQIAQAYSIMGRTCWLNIVKCSDVGSSFPTALWTHVLVVITAHVPFSAKMVKLFLKRCPFVENITPRYLYSEHSSITSPLKVNVVVRSEIWNFSLKTIILVFMTFNIRCHLWQFFVNLSSNLCNPVPVWDMRTRSSACSKWFNLRPPISILGSFSK